MWEVIEDVPVDILSSPSSPTNPSSRLEGAAPLLTKRFVEVYIVKDIDRTAAIVIKGSGKPLHSPARPSSLITSAANLGRDMGSLVDWSRDLSESSCG